MGGVYLIHFDQPLHHAQHYLGYAHDIPKRIRRHRKSQGSRLIEVVNSMGINWRVARTWDNAPRSVEQKYKRYHNNRKLCPICNPPKEGENG